jgi:transposase-like protein
MSPVVKERIYRLYLKGATPKELSLRFGILADRVKAIVF